MMEKNISMDTAYDDLVDRLVQDINESGMPMCCVRDILHRLAEQAQENHNKIVAQDKLPPVQVKNETVMPKPPERSAAPVEKSSKISEEAKNA